MTVEAIDSKQDWFKSLILEKIKELTFVTEDYFLKNLSYVRTGNSKEDDQMTRELFYELIKELISEKKIEYQLYTIGVSSNIYALFIDAEKEIKFING